jgi:hypothetical protein
VPKKPTIPFGHIAFGKDGSVRPQVEQLSSNKNEQELEVINRFVGAQPQLFNGAPVVEKLGEADQDGRISVDGVDLADVQCTEIVFRDIMAAEGKAVTEHAILDGKLIGIDCEKRRSVLRSKIESKLAKHYAKSPSMELWLILWSVTGYPLGEDQCGDTRIIPAQVVKAREFLAARGSAQPFDKIFYFDMQTTPTQIWPQNH